MRISSHAHLFACALLVFFLSFPAAAQNNKKMQKYFDMLDRCPQLMLSKKYDEALGLMAQIIKALEPKMSINRTYQRAVEFCYLQSGLAHLDSGSYAEALTWLNDFKSKFPRSPNVRVVILLIADTHAAMQSWDQVLAIVNPLVNKRGLGYEEEILIHELRSESYFNKKNYQEAGRSALHLIQKAREAEVRNNALIMYSTCLVRLKKYAELYRFIPVVYQTNARFDVGLNLALIEEGDKAFEAQQFENALLLFRLVFSSEVLAREVEKRMQEIEEMSRKPFASAQLNAARNSSTIKRKLNRLLKSYQKQQQKLEKEGNYDPELNMRVATCYFTLDRFLEAIHAFYGVYEDYPKHKMAERALYSTFTTAFAMGDLERAIKEAYLYLRSYPKGEYWEQLTVNLSQIRSQQEEFDESSAVAEKALSMKPNHSNGDQLVYLLGYNDFYKNEVDLARAHFDQLIQQYPQSSFLEAGAYWRAMCDLYGRNYESSTTLFTKYGKAYLGGPYYIDSVYRLAVSQYGQGDFDSALDTLESFLERFPEYPMVPDAANMLGDIYASRGLLDKAVETFRTTMKTSDDMVTVNYALFRTAKIFRLENRHEEIIELFEAYTQQYGEEGNFTESAYWIGTAYDKMGQRAKAMNIFFDTVVLYGDETLHHGVDMILRDLIREKDQWGDGEDVQALKQRLYAALDEAREDKKTTLSLRLTAFFSEVASEPEVRNRLLASLMKERYIPFAGPISLELMGAQAMRQGDHAMARKIFTEFLTKHGESDLSLVALRGMAELHIQDKDYQGASSLLEDIISRYAELEDAGWAQLRLADMHRLQKRYEQAVKGYKRVMAVKEWRGATWAEALYLTGMCELQQGRIREAFAFFQRTYVMYDGYPEWAAKSYLRSAECLQRLKLKVDARKTYEEMLANPALAGRPELQEARDGLKALGGGG